jgi:hypothetical protein
MDNTTLADKWFGRDKSRDYENLSSFLLNIHSPGIRAGGIGSAMASLARRTTSERQGASENQALAYQARLALR